MPDRSTGEHAWPRSAAPAAAVRLCHDRSGAALVEFAILAPVLVSLVIGLLEFSLFFVAKMTIESAVGEAARLGITGRLAGAETREEAIRVTLDARAGTLLDVAQLQLETLVYPDFSSIGQPEPWVDDNGNGRFDAGERYSDLNGNGQWDEDMGVPGAGGPNSIVLYRATYRWRFFTPLIRAFFPPDGSVDIVATTAVRNEPFPES